MDGMKNILWIPQHGLKKKISLHRFFEIRKEVGLDNKSTFCIQFWIPIQKTSRLIS